LFHWDEQVGTRNNPRTALNDAIRITAEHPRRRLGEISKNTGPNSWSLEGRSHAIDHAYLRGKLRGGISPETAISLPDGYMKTAKSVAERQAAIAGYRLAEEINHRLK